MPRKDLLSEELYDVERAEEASSEFAKKHGISRRQALRMMAVGGAIAAVAGSRRQAMAQTGPEIIKPAPPDLFIKSGTNLEMRWEAMYNRGYIVPNELFFVRNNSSVVPRIDPAKWRLEVHGSGVTKPRSFGYDEIVAMPSISVIRAIECAGNGRNFFEFSHGKKIEGTPWFLGGIGVAEWTGVPLREILERAGVKRTARDVMPVGLDEKGVSRPMSIEKAMVEDTLLVYAMNGDLLQADHGFPLRVLVPGWVGIANIKWVGTIEVSEQPLYSEYNTKKYVLIGEGHKASLPSLGQVLTTQKVKSAFELSWNGEIRSGKRLLRGRSWSGEGRIEKVVVSLDGGNSWQNAQLREPNLDLAWVRWDLEWNAHPGTYKLQARATDSKGNTQPLQIPFNQEGYSHWAVVSHPVKVT